MKINVKDIEKLNKVFDQANCRCTARTANSLTVGAYVTHLEKSLTQKGMPKKLWKGMKFSIQPGAERLPNAYYTKGFNPEATQFTLERGSSDWFVTEVSRGHIRQGKIILRGFFTEQQERVLISKAYKF